MMKEAIEAAAPFPRLRSRVDAGSDYADAPADTFDFGLQALLDGLAARIPDGRGHGADPDLTSRSAK